MPDIVQRFLLAVCFLVPIALQAEVEISEITRENEKVTLKLQGGYGPYLLETSQDLLNWSDQGEPAAGTTRTIPAFADRSFHRVMDLNPTNLYGDFFGLLQTEQGEVGRLMARHRLKTRIWLYKTKGAPHTSPSYTPASYWRKLLVNYQSQENGRVHTWSGPLEERGTVATPTSERMTVTWTSGTGSTLQTYLLTMAFPYPVNANRSTPPVPSDPAYELKCTYATAQPELEAFVTPPHFTDTTVDTVTLVQMDPSNDSTDPDQLWSVRNYRVSTNGVQVNLHFFEGLPLYQGSPPWIFKTLLLDRWLSPTTASGTSLPSFSTDSYFSRTLLPGHHNFWEAVLIEPALDPALPGATRDALTDSNIRQIYTWKDIAGVSIGGPTDVILYFGFDDTVREP
jgi:hypothetical protein